MHNLGGDIPADCRLDQAVDIGNVQAITGNPRPVDAEGQAWLSQLLHQCHVPNSAHAFKDMLDGFALLLKRDQIGAEDLDGKGTFQPVSASSTASSAGWV